MAEKKPETEGEAPPKKKGKLMLFVIIGVVVLVLAGGGAVYFIMKRNAENAAAAAEAEDGEDAPSRKSKKKDGAHGALPVFYKFDKPFTVKLQSEGQDSYLQIELQMRVLDVKIGDQLKIYDPELKHKITILLLSKKLADLNNPQGVQKLSNEIRDTANNILGSTGSKKKAAPPAEPADHADPDAPVQAVLFTSFIVQ